MSFFRRLTKKLPRIPSLTKRVLILIAMRLRRGHIRFDAPFYKRINPGAATYRFGPTIHYARVGFGQLADLSPYFSLAHYLAQHPGTSQTNLLARLLLQGGPSHGTTTHPLLPNPDARKPKVGIIILCFNEPQVTELCLRSILLHHQRTDFHIYLVDNGSSPPQRQSLRQIVEALAASAITFLELPKNLGFSGGNNVAIRRALDDDCTHICLLNSDVLVTAGWLDNLLKVGEPVIAPVSNAVGNEQTVPIDYVAERNASDISRADQFSRQWRRSFAPYVHYTDCLGFFCCLLDAAVVAKIGLLDEQFFPGGFEDNDYCMRIQQAGVRLAVARHVFLHHYGSASFSKLPMAARLQHIQDNLSRFEQKWQTQWVDWSYRLVDSFILDAERARFTFPFSRDQRFKRNILERHAQTAREAASWLARRPPVASPIPTHRLAEQKRLLVDFIKRTVPHEKPPLAAIVDPDPVTIGRSSAQRSKPALAKGGAYAALVNGTADCLLSDGGTAVLPELAEMQPLLASLAQAWQRDSRPLFVSANNLDPTIADERDGFAQRVLSVDESFRDFVRIYLRFDRHPQEPLALTWLADELAVLDVTGNDALQQAILTSALNNSSGVYVHSVFSADPRLLRHARAGLIPVVLDVHGVVPEEYEMINDPNGARHYGAIEADWVSTASQVVCVTESMAAHLRAKYRIDADRFVVAPIVSRQLPRDVSVTTPRTRTMIYTGGAQTWQQIPKMCQLIAALRGVVDYKIFTPNIDQIATSLVAAIGRSDQNLNVRSGSNMEVLEACKTGEFGILLRDDSIVNRVACPTKLVEYLATGLVPVLDSESVGGFVDLGMKFISFTDAIAGRLPTPDDTRVMAAHNLSVLDKLLDTAAAGTRTIRGVFEHAG